MEYTHNLIGYFNLKDVKLIVNKYCLEHDTKVIVESYNIENTCGKLLGFLSDYYKLTVEIRLQDDEKKVVKNLSFFIKAVSRSNVYKASIAKDWKVFDKEVYYYNFLKDFKKYGVHGLKQWNADLISIIQDDILVFEDLDSYGYKTKNKLERFDMKHTLQALRTLASFHASSLIYEETKSNRLKYPYRINQEFDKFADLGGYKMSDLWFTQCKDAAIETLKKHSKYGKQEFINVIERKWNDTWALAIEINNLTKHRCVLCHRDLWNNNMMFQYKGNEPDDCLLVDFQGIRYQPPASDIMVLLYCNLEPKFREDNMDTFLRYYYDELKKYLALNTIEIEKVLPEKVFYDSAEEQRRWGLVINACLLPQNCIDDRETAKYFENPLVFHDTLTKNKLMFIEDLIKGNRYDYKNKILETFEEIVERYIITTDL